MIVRLHQLNPVIGDLEGNVRKIELALGQAEAAGVDLLILPELSVPGYPPMDLLEVDAFRRECYAMNDQLVRKTSSTALLFGNITPNSGTGRPSYNTALLAQNGKLAGMVHKTLLPTYDVFDDLRYFEPNRDFACLNLMGVRLGVTICEDIWVNENEMVYHTYDVDPLMELCELGAEVMINLSASPFTKSKHERRLEMLAWNAKRCGRPVFYCNQVGTQTDVVHDGDTMVLDGAGALIAVTEAFEEDFTDVVLIRSKEKGVAAALGDKGSALGDKGLALGDKGFALGDKGFALGVGVDAMEAGSHEGASSALQLRVMPRSSEGVSDGITEGGGLSGESGSSEDGGVSENVGSSERNGSVTRDLPSVYPDHNRRMFDAICSGIRDYFQKTGAGKGAFIGLSGGIDSALVAVLATEAIGSDRVTGLLMPSGFSSEGSITDAEKLAQNLGIDTFQLPIGALYESALGTLSPVFGDRPFNTAEENLQSRIRGMLLMAAANKYGYLLLATGNKSEYAVGYATLYGDMNGALAPIGDLYKTEVYQLSRWLNNHYYERPIIPVSTLEKEPSAELRPDQKDSDSLPPYSVLDRILELAIEKQQSPSEIAAAGDAPEATVRHVMNLLERSEFKRFQAAPILKLSGKAFGNGRRRPIVQGWGRPG